MDRTGFLGGSDLVKLVNGKPDDWHTLWAIKTGRIQSEDLSNVFRVQLGLHTEEFNMQWAVDQLNTYVEGWQVPFSKQWERVPFKGTVDGVTGDGCIIEAKHTSTNRSMSDMLDFYMPQLQLYMWLAQKPRAYFSVIFGNNWDCVTVDFNGDLLDEYRDLSAKFWSYVQKDVAPPDDLVHDKIDWSKVRVDGLKARDASNDNHFHTLAMDYILTLPKAKQHEEVKKELKTLIQTDEREVFSNLLSIKRDKRGACRIYVRGEAG